MFSVNIESETVHSYQAHIKYQKTTTIYALLENSFNAINNAGPYNLIIQEDEKYVAKVSLFNLPPLSPLINITNLSIRYIKISDNRLPSLPPNLQILNLHGTSIHILDNLPPTLKMLNLSSNMNLAHVSLPSSLVSFEASYQTKFNTITFPPTIVYLRFYHCAFKRLNRLDLNTIIACLHIRPCFILCRLPYTDVLYNQSLRPYNAQPQLIFECIKRVNRQMDEDMTSIFYRIRNNSYSSNKIDCPIINAIRLASNPPRRFTEFIAEL